MPTPRNPIIVNVDNTLQEWQAETNALTNIINYFVRSSDGVFVADSAELTNPTISGGTLTNVTMNNVNGTTTSGTMIDTTLNNPTMTGGSNTNQEIINPTLSGVWDFDAAFLNIKRGNESERLAKGVGSGAELFYDTTNRLLYVFDGTIVGGRPFYPSSAENLPIAEQITIEDAAGRYTGLNVEDALEEIAGAGRSVETVKQNADDIDTLETNKVDKTTTITAGSGLAGGTQDLSTNITIEHLDTSSQTSLTGNTQGTVIQDIAVDTYGHITSMTTKDIAAVDVDADPTLITNSASTNVQSMIDDIDQSIEDLRSTDTTITFTGDISASVTFNNSGESVSVDMQVFDDSHNHDDRYYTETEIGAVGTSNITSGASLIGVFDEFTESDGTTVQAVLNDLDAAINTLQTTNVIAGSGLSGGGDLQGGLTIGHSDTSSQASVNNSGGTVIQDVTLDTYGHVTGLVSYNLDGRYYTETEIGGTGGAALVGTTDEFGLSNSTNVQDVLDDLDQAIQDINSGDLGAVYLTRADAEAVGTSNTTSGASIIGVFDEFTESNGTTVQAVLNDLDAAINTLQGITISAGGGLTGGGNLTANRTISHSDTSSQASVNNSGGTVIQDVTLDTYGHVTSLTSYNLDNIYPRLDTAETITGSWTFDGRVNIRDHIDLSDNMYLYFGSSDDVEMFFDGSGSHFYTDINSGGNWYIRDGNSSSATRFTFDIDTGNFTSANITIASAIYHSGDTDTYMQFHADDQWRVVTGGSERLEVNNNQITLARNTVVDAGTNSTLTVLSDDAGVSTINAYGSNQGTGVVYVGQSSTYGGGIFYNGDGTPAFATGETADHISFFRRENGSDHVIFSSSHASNNVTFRGSIDAVGFTENGNATLSNNITGSAGSVAWSNVTGRPTVAYESAIAADDFTQTEVNNLRAGKLDDGTTPWTSNNFYNDASVDAHLSGGGGITYSAGVISHSNTSSQSSLNYSGGTVIQDVTLDTYGHVTGMSGTNLDGRYPGITHNETITGDWQFDLAGRKRGTTIISDVDLSQGQVWSALNSHFSLSNDDTHPVFGFFRNSLYEGIVLGVTTDNGSSNLGIIVMAVSSSGSVSTGTVYRYNATVGQSALFSGAFHTLKLYA